MEVPHVEQGMRFRRPPAALPHLVLIGTASVLVAGCGAEAQGGAQENNPTESSSQSEDDSHSTSPSPDSGDSEEAPETELTIELSSNGADDSEAGLEDFEPGTWTLTCSPDGGDHPDPEAACADLEEVGPNGFDEVPDDQMCTHIYGGPQTAQVTGHLAGTEVDTEFSRADGCEIDRFDSMGTVLTP